MAKFLVVAADVAGSGGRARSWSGRACSRSVSGSYLGGP